MKFFDRSLNVMLRQKDKENLKRIAAKYPGRFDNPSHVARCAIIRFINTEKKDRGLWEKWNQ